MHTGHENDVRGECISVKEIEAFLIEEGIEVSIQGCKNITVNGFCSLNCPKKDSLLWIKRAEGLNSEIFSGLCRCIIVSKSLIQFQAESICFIITNEPKKVFFQLLNHFWKVREPDGIAQSAVVHGKTGKNVVIGDGSYISKESEIGSGTVIEHNVILQNKVKVGCNCIIHSGTVIGADGFGYCFDKNGKPEKAEHFGGVEIGDFVEIGANTCIDRGTIDDTIIGECSKIDNLVHIAHNVQIGKNVLVVAGSLICGSVKLEDGSYVAPGAIVKNQLEVGHNSFVGMGAVVTRNVESGTVVAGVPAKEIRYVRKGDK